LLDSRAASCENKRVNEFERCRDDRDTPARTRFSASRKELSQKMAGDNRSLVDSGYYQGLQRFEFFIVGVSLAQCAYVGYTLHPEKLTFLSAYTIEVVSLALVIFLQASP